MGKRTRISKMLVTDFEATCFEDRERTRNESELIEIGVVPIDLVELEVREDLGFQSYIQTRKSIVSQYCTDLTGIKTSDLSQKGHPISEVFRTVRSKYGGRTPWASWGDWDKNKLASECSLERIEHPFSSVHYNLKNLFGILVGNKKEIGLMSAINQMKMEFKGDHHSAYDDALNTARLFCEVLKDARNIK